MTRRTLFASLIGAPVAAATPIYQPVGLKDIRWLPDVEFCLAHRVTLNGQDITDRCIAADDREGWAECYVRDSVGNLVLTPDRRDVERETLTGIVRFSSKQYGFEVIQ